MAVVFGLDPLVVLDATADDMAIRVACAHAVEQMREAGGG